MKVAIYARVSKDTEKQDGRFQNPDNQLMALNDYCLYNKYEVVGIYIDKQSGADPNRPQFKQMLKHAERRLFEAIIVWKIDRFSREPMFVVLGYINKLNSYNVGLISMTETWLDTRKENPVSELILSIMSWFSADERRKISERTKLGIARKKAEGTYKGGIRGKDRKPRKKRKDAGEKRGVQEKTRLLIKESMQNRKI